MSVRQINKALHDVFARYHLTKTQRLILVAISDAADHGGGRAFPGHERLQRIAGTSRRWLQISLRRLQALGLLRVTRAGRGRGRRTYYRLTFGEEQPQLPGLIGAVEKSKNQIAFSPLSSDRKGDLYDTKGDLYDTFAGSAAPLIAASPVVSDEKAISDPSKYPSSTTKNTGADAPAPLRPVENRPGGVDAAASVAAVLATALPDSEGTASARPAAVMGRLEVRHAGASGGAGLHHTDGGGHVGSHASGRRVAPDPPPEAVAHLAAVKSRLFGGAR